MSHLPDILKINAMSNTISQIDLRKLQLIVLKIITITNSVSSTRVNPIHQAI